MPAKKLAYSEDARKTLRVGIDTLADSVKVTLGPKVFKISSSPSINTLLIFLNNGSEKFLRVQPSK